MNVLNVIEMMRNEVLLLALLLVLVVAEIASGDNKKSIRLIAI